MSRWRTAPLAVLSNAQSRDRSTSTRSSRWVGANTPRRKPAQPKLPCAASGTPGAHSWATEKRISPAVVFSAAAMRLAGIIQRLNLNVLYTKHAHCLGSDAPEGVPGFLTEAVIYPGM